MDRKLFADLVKSLHSTDVRYFKETEAPLQELEQKYCYHPLLQPCFLQESLSKAIRELPEALFIEIQDAVGIHMILFRLDGLVFLIGPFVTQRFQANRVTSVLMSHHLPASYLQSLKLFYSAFPLAADQEIIHSVKSIVRVLSPDKNEFAFRHRSSSDPEKTEQPSALNYQTLFDYQSIEKRYALENNFLRKIETGDSEHVLTAFDAMGISEMNARRYINSAYYVPEVSLGMIRALARKAAERGGASLIEINEITQRSVQRTLGLASEGQLIREIHSMILSLTEAVRRHQVEEGQYSPQIRKAVGLLRYNFSQSVSLEEIASVVGFAPTYLSRRFKEEVGRTIPEHVRILRCSEAARQLLETNTPVADIAAYVGYPDNNYFSKAFKQTYGKSPSAYRAEKSRG